MAYRRNLTYWASIPLRGRGRKRVPLGTRDRRVAEAIERTLRQLHDRREWELLEAALSGPLTPGDVYDASQRDQLDALRARLNDVDLRSLVQPYRDWLRSRVSASTGDKYVRQLRHLVPEDAPFLRSELTRARVAGALHGLEESRSGSTVRRYHAAFSSFFRFLVDIDVLHDNPARRIRLPRENAPRERWLTQELSMRLVEAHEQSYGALAALREGAGVEIGAALLTRRRDVDRDRRIVHVHGTKRASRDRFVRVDDWAWAHVDKVVRPKLPDALLWEGVTYDAALHAHRKACEAISIEDYRMHDARHSYAVRHMKAGDDPFLIANQLGHKDATMVLRVYGKYRPTPDDFRRISGAGGADK